MKNLQELTQKYYGYGNECINEPSFIDHHNQYLNTKKASIETQELYFNGCPSFGRKCSMNINFNPQQGKKYAFTNLRTNNPEYHKLFRSIELEIGGSQIDKIYGKIIPTLCHLYKLNTDQIPFYFNRADYFLPRLSFHESRLYFEFEKETDELKQYGQIDDLKFYIDIYEVEYDGNDYDFDHMITQIQFTGEEPVCGGCNAMKIKNCFNHIVTHLLIYSENCEINKMNFVFRKDSNSEVDILDIDLPEKHNGIYIIPLVKSLNDFDITQGLNYSTPDFAHTNLWFDKGVDFETVSVFAISVNSMRMLNGMCGLRFAS